MAEPAPLTGGGASILADFRARDVGRTGWVAGDRLRAVLLRAGCSKADVDLVLGQVPARSDGAVRYETFLAALFAEGGSGGTAPRSAPPRARARRLLAAGTPRLLSAAWLLARGESYVLQRLQDLPLEAFVSPQRAAELFDELHGVVVVSYGWLSRRHPDPAGFHLRTVRRYLQKHKEAFLLADYGVFWDFASLPQDQPDGTKRTEQEERVFEAGLGAVGLLYGDGNTHVIQLTRMPEEPQSGGGAEGDLAPYGLRGWCFFEATVAGLAKGSRQLLDLGAGAEALEREGVGWTRVADASSAARLPPLAPEDMAAELARRRFGNAGNAGIVAAHYADFFREAAAGAQRLHLANRRAGPGWGDEELTQLARALPAFAACQLLSLRGHEALGEGGVAKLRAQLQHLPALKTLWLPRHLEHTEEGRALQAEWLAGGRRMWDGIAGLDWD